MTTANALPDTDDAVRPHRGIQALDTAVDVLDCFTLDTRLGVTDIARRLGVSKSTAHRVLTTLCERGLTAQDPATGLYQLGVHHFELGQLAQERNALRLAAMPLLSDLQSRTGLTIYLSVPDGADIVHLARLETPHPQERVLINGHRLPSHTCASGHAIAAYRAEFAHTRRSAGYPPRTVRTIRTEEAFDHALRHTRQVGYGVVYEEAVPGVIAIAAPVRPRPQAAIAALCVAGSTSRLSGEERALGTLLTAAANRLGRISDER
ncbi:MAG: IclR family transcriptional regulator [Nostocoides sp.]